VKNYIFSVTSRPIVSTLLRRLKSGPTILFYHGVEEDITDSRVQSLHLPMRAFEEQISFLRKNFEIVSIDYLHDCLATGNGLKSSQIVLTFDDGYRNNLTVAAPYLQSLGVPFSVFVSTKHISDQMRFPTYVMRVAILHTRNTFITILGKEIDVSSDRAKNSAILRVSRLLKTTPLEDITTIYEELLTALSKSEWTDLDGRFLSDEPMTWDEVRSLSKLGATIGSHCHDHFLLHGNQSLSEVADQLRKSKELIDENIGDCKYIAYPNGTKNDITSKSATMVHELGFSIGLTTINGEVSADSSPLLLPRIGTATTNLEYFKFSVNTSFRRNRDHRKWAMDLL